MWETLSSSAASSKQPAPVLGSAMQKGTRRVGLAPSMGNKQLSSRATPHFHASLLPHPQIVWRCHEMSTKELGLGREKKKKPLDCQRGGPRIQDQSPLGKCERIERGCVGSVLKNLTGRRILPREKPEREMQATGRSVSLSVCVPLLRYRTRLYV